MAWVKVPPHHHHLFRAALPSDPRVETMQMFGGVAARVNGHLFAGLFGLSTMIWLPEPERAEALALDGASLFDPMGDGRVRSDKVMLPASMMIDAPALKRWVGRAFKAAAALPPKAAKAAKAAKEKSQEASKKTSKKTPEKGAPSRKAAAGSKRASKTK
ncbi:MAG TPA: hypothetical protein VKU41_02695 [Polyangiaceae bacterium]|nr:hypothetical protein [Polyangiaceae bacterium]